MQESVLGRKQHAPGAEPPCRETQVPPGASHAKEGGLLQVPTCWQAWVCKSLEEQVSLELYPVQVLEKVGSRYYSLACGKMPADGLPDPGDNLLSAKKTGHSM